MFDPQAHGLDWMRGLNRATLSLILAVALTGVTCAFPTDKSEDVFVAVYVPKLIVRQGEKLPVSATLWQQTGADSVEIKNASFLWGTTNEGLATVKDAGYGSAEVTGILPGTVDLSVRAVSFEKSETKYVTLRVAKPLEIDSVRPITVHYGELLTVYGVGVDSLFIASLGGANLIEYPLSRLRDSTGLGQITFWVPPPARSDSLFYLGAGVFGFDTAMTDVLKDDIFEPNDTIPSNINLDLGGPWQNTGTLLDSVLFLNPALAFEPVDNRTSSSGEDWFRFAISDTTKPLTFFITYPTFGDTSASATRTFVLDSLAYLTGVPGDPVEKFFGRDSADFISSDFYRCKGDFFGPAQLSRESTTVALRTLPSHALHVMTFFNHPQRYGLTVAKGYITADFRIPMDKYEENDMCHYADSIPGKPNPLSRIHVPTRASGLQFNDSVMTIDNPFEVDWYRLEVPASGLGDSVLIRTQSRPLISGRDTSDIDIYVLRVPGVSDTVPGSGVMDIVGQSIAPGSSEDLLVDLPAGSYYLAVVDFAGVVTRYSMCVRVVAVLPNCGPLAGSPPAPGTSPSRLKVPRASPAAPVRSGKPALLRRP
jgi:hypothetical protein